MRRAWALLLLTAPVAAGEIYADGGAAYVTRHGACHDAYNAKTVYCTWDTNGYAPARAHIELGLAQPVGRTELALYLRHESYLGKQDYGINEIGVRARVSLWKGGTP